MKNIANKKSSSNQKRPEHLIENDMAHSGEADTLTDEEISQSIIDSIDDGLKLMRLARNNVKISPCECTDAIVSIVSRLSFATAVINPHGIEEIKSVMGTIFVFCGTITTSKHCFVDKPELIERIYPFFETLREWVEALILHKNNYDVASNISSSLISDIESFEVILGVRSKEKEEKSDDFCLF